MLDKIAIAKMDARKQKTGYLLNFASGSGQGKQVSLHSTELLCELYLTEIPYVLIFK